MSLLTELAAVLTDHRACGELDGGVAEPTVWLACECAQRPPAALTRLT